MPASKGDSLRIPEKAYLPDSRSSAFGLNDISDQYERIEVYKLENYVPEKVFTQYEVARNLHLYAYNVYRFYMVAQQQALVVLEMAIKECFDPDVLRQYAKEIGKTRGLYTCLRYVIDKGFIENADFPAWHRGPKLKAEYEYSIAKMQEMREKGLEEIDLNYSEAVVTTTPEDFDYLEVLLNCMPKMRNSHAHGTDMLHNQVLITFENVSTIINKIYKPK